MKVPACVLWGLTRKHNAFKVQQAGAKSRLECFSKDPLNLTGLHNQSSAGFCNDDAIGLQASKGKSKSGKSFRRVYHLRVGHKSYHRTNRVLKSKCDARLTASCMCIKRDTAHAAKTIKGLTGVNEKKRTLLLRRLGRLHAAFKGAK